MGRKFHIQFTGDELCGSRAEGLSGKRKTVRSPSVYTSSFRRFKLVFEEKLRLPLDGSVFSLELSGSPAFLDSENPFCNRHCRNCFALLHFFRLCFFF